MPCRTYWVSTSTGSDGRRSSSDARLGPTWLRLIWHSPGPANLPSCLVSAANRVVPPSSSISRGAAGPLPKLAGCAVTFSCRWAIASPPRIRTDSQSQQLVPGLTPMPGATNSEAGLPDHLGALYLHLLAGAAEDVLEGLDALDADAGECVRDETSDAAPRPDEAVLLRGEEAVADGFRDPRVHRNPQGSPGLGGHRQGQEPGGVLVHVQPRFFGCWCGTPAYFSV